MHSCPLPFFLSLLWLLVPAAFACLVGRSMKLLCPMAGCCRDLLPLLAC